MRQIAFERFLEQVFASGALDPHPFGQPCGELDEAVIEQRLARFKAHRHAGAVDLGEDVAGHPEHQVGILRTVKAGAAWRGAHQGDQLILAAEAFEAGGEAVRIQRPARIGQRHR